MHWLETLTCPAGTSPRRRTGIEAYRSQPSLPLHSPRNPEINKTPRIVSCHPSTLWLDGCGQLDPVLSTAPAKGHSQPGLRNINARPSQPVPSSPPGGQLQLLEPTIWLELHGREALLSGKIYVRSLSPDSLVLFSVPRIIPHMHLK